MSTKFYIYIHIYKHFSFLKSIYVVWQLSLSIFRHYGLTIIKWRKKIKRRMVKWKNHFFMYIYIFILYMCVYIYVYRMCVWMYINKDIENIFLFEPRWKSRMLNILLGSVTSGKETRLKPLRRPTRVLTDVSEVTREGSRRDITCGSDVSFQVDLDGPVYMMVHFCLILSPFVFPYTHPFFSSLSPNFYDRFMTWISVTVH